eukprot:UN11471
MTWRSNAENRFSIQSCETLMGPLLRSLLRNNLLRNLVRNNSLRNL